MEGRETPKIGRSYIYNNDDRGLFMDGIIRVNKIQQTRHFDYRHRRIIGKVWPIPNAYA